MTVEMSTMVCKCSAPLSWQLLRHVYLIYHHKETNKSIKWNINKKYCKATHDHQMNGLGTQVR